MGENISRLLKWGAVIAGAFLFVATVINMTVVNESSIKDSRAIAGLREEKTRLIERTPILGGVKATKLVLRMPAAERDVLAVGYHQAYNIHAAEITSAIRLEPSATTASISRDLKPGDPIAFVMESRGRGSAPTSAVDIALAKDIAVKSPVSGTVCAVVDYKLYGLYEDIRIEIIPDGYPDLKIAIIHVESAQVKAGQKLEAGVTPIGRPRQLVVDSQIDQYLGKVTKHIHIQINPKEAGDVANIEY